MSNTTRGYPHLLRSFALERSSNWQRGNGLLVAVDDTARARDFNPQQGHRAGVLDGYAVDDDFSIFGESIGIGVRPHSKDNYIICSYV